MSNYPDGYYGDEEAYLNAEATLEFVLPVPIDVYEDGYAEIYDAEYDFDMISREVVDPDFGVPLVNSDEVEQAIQNFVCDIGEIKPSGIHHINILLKVTYALYDVVLDDPYGGPNTDNAQVDSYFEIMGYELVD